MTDSANKPSDKTLIKQAKEAISTAEKLNERSSDLWSAEERQQFEDAQQKFDEAKVELKKRHPKSKTKQTDGKSSASKGAQGAEIIYNTPAYAEIVALVNKDRPLPDPCGKSELSKISISLQNFFETLKAIKKHGNFYLQNATNKVGDIKRLVKNTSKIIGSVLKSLIQRARDFLLDQIRSAISAIVDMLFPTIAKVWKNTIIGQIVNTILCKFKDIIAGLANLVQDFLFELIGKVVNIPFCAAQQFTNALVNNVASAIDKALGPVLDQISNLLGGVGKIAGSIFEAIDFVLGFESFLCTTPNCPEIKKFKASPFIKGPTPADQDNFDNFLPIPDAEDISGDITGYIDNLSIFGTKLGDTAGTIDSNITQCNTAAYECGPPKVEIFGGGGIGAFGNAVVDMAGKIAGVNLGSGGSGYSSPPFVTFMDTCNRGNHASAYTEINDEGEVIRIIMVNPGNGYLNAPDGTNEFEPEEDYIDSLIGTLPLPNLGIGIPTPVDTIDTVDSDQVNDYIICLDEFQVMSTGIGYTVEDEVIITPDIPNLEASVQMSEQGQIISIQILNSPCGLTVVPTITINSETGAGAKIKPLLSFTRLGEDLDQEIPDTVVSVDIGTDSDTIATLAERNIVRVIDCPTDTCIGCK